MRDLVRRPLRALLSIGAHSGESDDQAARRRIFVGITTGAGLLSIPFVFDLYGRGFDLVAAATLALVIATPVELLALHLRPNWFRPLVHLVFAMVTVHQFYVAWLFGGLLESGLAVVFGLVVAVAALMVLGRAAAYFWFGMYLVQVVFSMAIAGEVAPTYVFDDATSEAGLNLIALGILTMGAVIYFVRQRDRFQKESDDLLHNILPNEIATRLKADTSMIADDFAEASVLFADVVGFTPMSAAMTPRPQP